MDPFDAVQKFGAEGAWAGAALFLAISVYSGVKMMGPVWVDRYKLQTKLLTERDAKHAGEIARKLNGRAYQDIARYLSTDADFRSRFAPRHQLDAIEKEQQRIFATLDTHVREDRDVHERVKALEVEMEQVKENVREIKADLKAAAETVTAEATAMRQERNDGERRILEHIDELFERRRESR